MPSNVSWDEIKIGDLTVKIDDLMVKNGIPRKADNMNQTERDLARAQAENRRLYQRVKVLSEALSRQAESLSDAQAKVQALEESSSLFAAEREILNTERAECADKLREVKNLLDHFKRTAEIQANATKADKARIAELTEEIKATKARKRK